MKINTILFIGAESTLLRDLIIILQEDETLQVEHTTTRLQALNRLQTREPDVVVFSSDDAGVIDLTFCQEVRNLYRGLFLHLSNMNNSHFQVLALKMGVDASFIGSCGPLLIAGNIQSLLRRFVPSEPVTRRSYGNLAIDYSRRDVFIDDVAVNLSTIEFDIFRYMVQKPGCVVSRNEIHKEIYDAEYNGYDRSIDLYISRIRQKIGDCLHSPVFLKTVRGAGYQFIGAPNERKPIGY